MRAGYSRPLKGLVKTAIFVSAPRRIQLANRKPPKYFSRENTDNAVGSKNSTPGNPAVGRLKEKRMRMVLENCLK